MSTCDGAQNFLKARGAPQARLQARAHRDPCLHGRGRQQDKGALSPLRVPQERSHVKSCSQATRQHGLARLLNIKGGKSSADGRAWSPSERQTPDGSPRPLFTSTALSGKQRESPHWVIYTSTGWRFLFEVSVRPAGFFYLRLGQTTAHYGGRRIQPRQRW